MTKTPLAIDNRTLEELHLVIKRLIAIIFLKLSAVQVWRENDVLVVITVLNNRV